MHDVDSPADFAKHLRGGLESPGGTGTTYWPDDVERPEDVEVHPQGQVYVRFGDVDQPAETALYVIQIAERCGLRPEVDTSRSISIFEPRPECADDGCFAKASGTKPHRDLCAGHTAEREHARRQQGLPPER